AAAGDVEAAQLAQRRRGVFDEGERVVAYRQAGSGAVQLGHEIPKQYLAWPGALQHARQVHRNLAHDAAERGRVEPVDLVELVVLADVKGGPQNGHPGVARLAACDRVVGQDHQQQLQQLRVRLDRGGAIPDVEAVAGGGAGKVDLDVLQHELLVGGV